MILIAPLFTLAYTAACLALGLGILGLVFSVFRAGNTLDPAERTTTAFMLGLGVFAAIWEVLGLAGVFHSWLIWVAIVFALLFWGRVLLSECGRVLDILRSVLKEVSGFPLAVKFLAFVLLIDIAFFAFGSMFRPPDSDAVAFYMVLPKAMAAMHRLVPQANYHDFSQIGLVGEMHYAALMSIGIKHHSAMFFTWFAALCVASVLVLICARAGIGITGKIAALLMLFASTAFTENITNGKVDVFAALFGLGAYYWALKSVEEDPGPRVFLAGFFTGLAVIAKFSYLLCLVPGVMLLLGWNMALVRKEDTDGQGFRGFLMIAAVFAISASMPALVHLYKNWTLFGEPLAPFYFFGTAGENWAQQTWYSRENTIFILLTYPIALTLGQYPMQGGNISALVLAFAPFAGFLPRPANLWRSELFRVTMAGIAGTALWMALRPSVLAPRYILATLLMFIPFAAASAESLLDRRVRSRLLYYGIVAALVLSVAFAAKVPMLEPSDPSEAVVKAYKFPKQFVRTVTGVTDGECDYAWAYCRALVHVNEVAGDGARVYLAGHYSYFLRDDLLVGISTNEEQKGFESLEGRQEKLGFLFSKGFGYVVVQKWTHKKVLDILLREERNNPPEAIKIYEDAESAVLALCRNGI